MTETVLAMIAFVLIIILAVVEMSNGLTIKRLKKVIDDLYFEVAQDRSEMYKELTHIQDSYDVTQAELKLLAERCNRCEGCECKRDSCPKELPKETSINKPKRPRKPKQ